MSKFFILGTYSPESYEGFIKNPEQDRKALAQALAKAYKKAGGGYKS